MIFLSFLNEDIEKLLGEVNLGKNYCLKINFGYCEKSWVCLFEDGLEIRVWLIIDLRVV